MLLMSDSPNRQQLPFFDLAQEFVQPFNTIQEHRRVQLVMVLDCCRQSPEDKTFKHRGPGDQDRWMDRQTWLAERSENWHDWYIAFSCDPGRSAGDTPAGGLLMQQLVPLLHYKQPIHNVLFEAASRVRSAQRPWTLCRPPKSGDAPPKLGYMDKGWPPPPVALDGSAISESADEGADTTAPITVLLVGETGVGKSELGNSLVQCSTFKVGGGLNSATSGAAHQETMFNGKSWRVIDTVGFLDTEDDAPTTVERFVHFADLAPEGIDVILFVYRWQRFGRRHLKLLDTFTEVLGEGALDHTLVVFTHVGEQVPETDFQRFCDGDFLAECQANKHVQDMLQKVKGALAAEKRTQEERDFVRERILAAAESLVASGLPRYTNAALCEAKQRRDEIREIVGLLRGKRRDGLEEQLERVYSGGLTSSELLKQARAERLAQDEEVRKATSPHTVPCPDQVSDAGRQEPQERAAVRQVFDAFQSVGQHYVRDPELSSGARMFLGVFNGLTSAMRNEFQREDDRDGTEKGRGREEAQKQEVQATPGQKQRPEMEDPVIQEALSSLLSVGYKRENAALALEEARKEIPGADAQVLTNRALDILDAWSK